MGWPWWCPFVMTLALTSVMGDDILPKVQTVERPYKQVSMPYISSQDIEAAFTQGEKKAQERANIEQTLSNQGAFISKSAFSAAARSQRFNAIDPKSMRIDTNQKTFEEAANYLSNKYQLTRDQKLYGLPRIALPNYSRKAQQAVTKCQSEFGVPYCDSNYVFRTPDGSCNNLDNPTWGRSFTCFQRILEPAYDDGLGSPRLSVTGNPLPNPRVVSTSLHPDVDQKAQDYTLITMQWGQFMDHDLTLTPMTRAGTNMDMIECCNNPTKHPACFQIDLPPADYFFAPRGQSCLNFVRSAACNADCALGPRQQTNQLTAFIDASNIYGSEQNNSDSLRLFRDGLLNFQTNQKAGVLLPQSIDPVNDQCSRQEGLPTCFHAGDERVNEQPGLTCMHTIWLRQHNRIAAKLKAVHPYATDEDIYQNARKIVGAQLQAVTYGEFLPVVLGPAYAKFFNLPPGVSGQYTLYDPDTEPSIMHSFATAAYRFGHTLISNIFPEINKFYQQYSFLNLSENFFFPLSVFNNELPDIVRGLYSTPAEQFDRFVVASVTNNLYKQRGTPFGMDLVALNLQRGRDHGLQPYYKYIDFCSNSEIQITSFDDLYKKYSFMTKENALKLTSVYSDIKDVDLFSAGILETPLSGGVVGPTFGCLIGIQFHQLKFGDRFYFEHNSDNPYTYFQNFFTQDQIEELRKTKLSKVLCDNAGIDYISRDVFLPNSPKLYCSQLPEPDISIF